MPIVPGQSTEFVSASWTPFRDAVLLEDPVVDAEFAKSKFSLTCFGKLGVVLCGLGDLDSLHGLLHLLRLFVHQPG